MILHREPTHMMSTIILSVVRRVAMWTLVGDRLEVSL